MKREQFYLYAKEALIQSILALVDKSSIESYYGDPAKCTLESYFSAQIKGKSLYSQADEQTIDTLLISDYSEYNDVFEDARQTVMIDVRTFGIEFV